MKKIAQILAYEASQVRENAFAARSEHKIGAAVLTSENGIFTGCNIESNISGLGICAERNAINNAIIHGKYSFKMLVTYDEKPLIPCGACLQYLMEFQPISGLNIQIIAAGANNEIKTFFIKDLLPQAYKASRGKEKLKPYMNQQ